LSTHIAPSEDLLRGKRGKSFRHEFLGCDWLPHGGGAAATGLGVVGGGTLRGEVLQRGINALNADMSLEEFADLIAAQAVGVGIEGAVDGGGDLVFGGRVEEEAGGGGAVIPYGEGGFEVELLDDGAAVERGVEGAEAEDLGFGAAGGGSVEAGTALAEGWVAVVPKLLRALAAFEGLRGRSGCPVE
jgi:hypothetical protein